jgi:hypothetical protein
MIVAQERVLAVPFTVASARLVALPYGHWFQDMSQTVYQGGVEYLTRVGPAGAMPGASRLVRVQFTEPARRDGTVTLGLRWEATGVTSGLFPALDADIRLSDRDGITRITLTGSYRPPFGPLGAGLDWLFLRTVATATLKTLLARIAAALEGVSAETEQPAAWQPELEAAGP